MKAPNKLNKKPRHDPLHIQMDSDKTINPMTKRKREKYVKREEIRERKDANVETDEKLSKKIMEQARRQLAEEEDWPSDENGIGHGNENIGIKDISDEEFIDDDEEEFQDYQEFDHDFTQQLNHISAEEENIIAQFMPSKAPERRNLAEMIMTKFKEHESSFATTENGHSQKPIPPHINEKVAEVYFKVGTLLSRYRSGKLPKAFKIIPSLKNWEEIVYLTNPEQWSPHAMYQATRIFASNLKPRMAQRFYNLILLEAIRTDISENKKVNYHLYMALKKATYKPSAWFKGILLPVCESGCTLKEAVILGSVLSKMSIPVLHSAAALMKLADMDYTGANSIFIRILLDKKYALPFRVIDSLVMHFLRFKTDSRDLPVLWHQSLLVFCQRYKEDIAPEQKEALFDLLKHQCHHQITPEVRRELINSKCRDSMDVTLPETSEMAIKAAFSRQ